MPEALEDILLDHPWELSKLLALDLPVEEVSVQALAWQLDLPWWRVGADWFVVTPNQVLDDPTGPFREQWERTMRADLGTPIHVRITEKGLLILDGVHRLLRAVVEGRSSLAARVVPDRCLASIYRTEPPSDDLLAGYATQVSAGRPGQTPGSTVGWGGRVEGRAAVSDPFHIPRELDGRSRGRLGAASVSRRGSL